MWRLWRRTKRDLFVTNVSCGLRLTPGNTTFSKFKYLQSLRLDKITFGLMINIEANYLCWVWDISRLQVNYNPLSSITHHHYNDSGDIIHMLQDFRRDRCNRKVHRRSCFKFRQAVLSLRCCKSVSVSSPVASEPQESGHVLITLGGIQSLCYQHNHPLLQLSLNIHHRLEQFYTGQG